jgi:hypothetical protein
MRPQRGSSRANFEMSENANLTDKKSQKNMIVYKYEWPLKCLKPLKYLVKEAGHCDAGL